MKPSIAPLVLLLVVLAVSITAWLWFRAGSTEPQPEVTAVQPAGSPTPSASDPGQPARGEALRTAADVATDRAPTATDPGADSSANPDASDDEPAATGPWLRGRVVDARGAGLENARVVLADERAEQLPFAIAGLDDMMADAGTGVRTAADGSFAIRMPRREGGDYRLIASHAEHPRSGHRGSATADVQGIVITLRDGVSITGRVVGAPADTSGVRVFCKRLEGGLGTIATSAVIDLGGLVDALGIPIGARHSQLDDEAQFELRGLDPDSSYRVWAAQVRKPADGGESPAVGSATGGEAATGEAATGEAADHVLGGQWRKATAVQEFRAGTRGIELQWRNATIVTVRVVDARTNTPIERLAVSAGTVRELTVLGMSVPVPTVQPVEQRDFPAGIVQVSEFEAMDAESATLALEIRAEGKKPWIRHDIDASRAVGGEIDLGIASLETAPVIVAQVSDGATGQPVAGAEVELSSHETDSAESASEADGGSGSVSFSTTASVDSERAESIDLGEPDAHRKGRTDAAGQCRITPAFTGQAQVVVQAEGYAPAASAPFELLPAGDQPVTVELRRGGGALVQTRDGHGATLENAMVQRRGPIAGDEETKRTDASGQHTFRGLTPGEHTFRLLGTKKGDEGGLRVRLDGLMNTEEGETVVVRDGATAEVVLIEPLRGSLTGTVTSNGRPLDRAQIQLLPAGLDDEESVAREMASHMIEATVSKFLGGESQTGQTDVDGRFRIATAEVGDYRLVVRHQDFAMPATQPVRINEGDNQVTVALQLTTVKGRVVDDRGEPVARATVTALPANPEALEVATQMGDARGMLASILGGGGGGDEIRTDENGNFELRGVRSGMALAIQAQARLHVAASTTIQPIVAGTTRDSVEVVLPIGGRVSVSAVGVSGALAARATWAGPNGEGGSSPRQRDGILRRSRTTIDGLTPGRWRIELTGLGAAEDAPAQFVEIERGKTARAAFGR